MTARWVTGALLWLLARDAFAAPTLPPIVRFALDGAGVLDGCVTEDALRTAVTARIGRNPFRADAADELRVALTRDGEVLHARIERVASSGSRGGRELEMPAADCAGVLDTLTLSIAIAIDPLALGSVAPLEPPPAPPHPPRAKVPISG